MEAIIAAQSRIPMQECTMNVRQRRWLVSAAAAAVLAVAGSCQARTWLVPGDVPTLAAGLAAAVAGDTVLVACGTYLEHDLALAPGVTLRSETGDPICVTVDAQRRGRILNVGGGQPAAVIEGLTLKGGWVREGSGDGLGGGIRCVGSSLVVSHCLLSENCAPLGGGIGAVSAMLSVDFCTFAADSAAHATWGAGGGVYVKSSTGTVHSCAFTANVARGTAPATPGDGGAIFSRQSTLAVSESEFTGNVSGGGAGAVYSYLSDGITLTGCDFSSNSGAWGGAVYCEALSSAAFRDCRFLGNTAQTGGALEISWSDPIFADCTFASNRALAGGGGAATCWNSTYVFQGCLFLSNQASLGGGAVTQGVGPDFDGCVFAGNTSGTAGGAVEVKSGPAKVTGCTIVANAAPSGGALRSQASTGTVVVERSLLCFATSGQAISGDSPSAFSIACSDIYGNVGGDWTGPIAEQLGINGNIAADPLFCGAETGDYHVASDSPCSAANQGECGGIGAFGVGCGTTAVPGTPPAGATILAARCFPNPFNPRATIAFELGSPATVAIGIYTLDGRLVRNLFTGPLGAGAQQASWDGRDADGAALASGAYLCRLRAGAETVARKLVLLK
jgi:hypothetical protein